MNWTSPELLHILDERLQQARIELMDDQRVAGALSNSHAESQMFIAELIEKKLAAAAHAGLDAVEASLRVEATDALLAAGMELEEVREALQKAGAPLHQPAGIRRSTLAEVAFSPIVLAALTLCACMILVLALWAALRFSPILLGLLVALCVAPALAVKKWREQSLAAMRKKVAGELPARICRHYAQVYEEAVRSYEDAVNTLLKAAETAADKK